MKIIHIQCTILNIHDLFKKEIEFVGLKIISYNIQFGEIWTKIGFIN